jgi:hypothetical protein
VIVNKPSILGTILNGQLQSDLFSLLSFFVASKELANLAAGDQSGGLRELLAKSQNQMVIEVLIRCATKIRILDDLTLFPRDSERLPPVGFWLDETGPRMSKALLLRDACNKIIHCEEIEFKPSSLTTNEVTHWTGLIILKGVERGKRWRVLIEVEKFVISAAPYVDRSWMHEV